MEGLRERRRTQTSELSIPARASRRPQDTFLIKRRYIVSAGLILSFQSLLILFLSVKLLSSRPSREHGVQAQLTETRRTHNIYSNEKAQQPVDVLITIYSYDRPRQLRRLLEDIAAESDAAGLSSHVHVIDDNSMGCVSSPVGTNFFDLDSAESHKNGAESNIEKMPLLHISRKYSSSEAFLANAPCSARSRFRLIEALIRRRNWDLFVSYYRHGRRRYWHLIRMAHELLRNRNARYYLFLPDDDRLAKNFFPKAFEAWNTITDARKTTLMLHIEESRENASVWTNVKPRRYGGDIFRIGWVESGNFLCDKKLLELLNWSFPRVPIERWVRNPPISSGVGSTLSEIIHGAGLRMYRTRESLVAHVGVRFSKMNSEFREKNKAALLTRYFADGNHVYEQHLREAASVSASMASTWEREASLHVAVSSLSTQVDHLNVYLNGYDVVPVYLQQPFITAVLSSNVNGRGDIGDVGKFYWCNNLTSEYHATVDDDIVYPEDYVEKLLRFRNSYSSPTIVGVHGIRIKQHDLVPSDTRTRSKGYYGSRRVWMAIEDVRRPVTVHILGTGTILYKVEDLGTISVDEVFSEPNMADIWLGVFAQQRTIPMVVMPHEAGWMQEVNGTFSGSIYVKSTKSITSDRLQTRVARDNVPWKLHEPISMHQ